MPSSQYSMRWVLSIVPIRWMETLRPRADQELLRGHRAAEWGAGRRAAEPHAQLCNISGGGEAGTTAFHLMYKLKTWPRARVVVAGGKDDFGLSAY